MLEQKLLKLLLKHTAFCNAETNVLFTALSMCVILRPVLEVDYGVRQISLGNQNKAAATGSEANMEVPKTAVP